MLALPPHPPTQQVGPDALLQALFDASATGIAQLEPVYAAGQPEALVDFTYRRLNPAAQRQLGLPEHPATTLGGTGPQSAAFAFYRATFLAGEPAYSYLSGTTAAGQPYTLHVAAQRSGPQLVASFTEVPRLASAAPADTAAAPAEQVFWQVFDQTPAAICLLHGPEYRFEYVNPAFGRLFPGRQLVGRTAAEALPEALPQGVAQQLDQVYQTGISYAGVEVPLTIAQPHDQPPRQHYFNFIYQAHPENGQPTRLSLFANDVTDKVLARQQRDAQWAEQQQVFEQAPVAIAVLRGPGHLIELANPAICALWGCQPAQLLGKPLAEALPGVADQHLRQLLAQVLATGVPYVAYEQASARYRPGRASQAYLNIVCQPLREADGQITGLVLVVADVSEQMHSHQRVRQLNEELHVVNGQLRAANEELLTNNQELAQAQQKLRRLNQELECRVASGVRAAQEARDDAERQRQQLARFFQQAPAAICALDGSDLVFELVNPGYQRLFPGRELLGKPLLEAAPELLGQPIYHWLREVYDTGAPHEGHEVPFVVYNPAQEEIEEHYFDCVYQARQNDQGRIDGVLVFALDITEKVLAQRHIAALQAEAQAAAARQAQERETFYQIFEDTPALVSLMWGPEHRFVYANRAFEQLFPGRELRNLPLAEALPETADQGFQKILDHVYQSGENYLVNEAPLVVTRPGGQNPQELYLNLAYQAYREHGQTLGVSVFAYDVTPQVLARREQEASQVLLRTVFEQAPVALALLQGPAYVVAVANLAISQLWGRHLADITGQPLFELLPEAAGQGTREILDEVRRTGVPFVAHEQPTLLLRWGQAETLYFDLVYQPLADVQGEFSSVVIVATDMTPGVLARQRADQAFDDLRITNEQLTRTNADLDTFIYTASHDLKSPIANIEGLLLLLRKQLPAEARQAGMVPRLLDMMQGAIERFQLTIAQLTDLAKLQHAHTQPAEEVDLPAMVEAVRLDLAPMLEEAHAELHVQLDSCLLVSFAPQHLRSILYNLLSNAIKYRHATRPLVVRLRCRRAGTATALEVEDNGLGLSPEQQQKLFSMFRRLHDHVPGSGVGLYMVKRIVENAGGSVQVRSQPDVGSTFTVSFPSQRHS